MSATRKKAKLGSTSYRTKKRKKGLGYWLLTGVGLGGVALLSATAGAWLALSLSVTPLKQAELTPEEEAIFSQEEAIDQKNLQVPALSRPVNILILGTKVLTSDVNGDPEGNLGYHALVNSFKGHSDTMLLARFDPQHQKLAVLSIPRDTQVQIDEYGTAKINFANYYGGPAVAAQAVSTLLGDVSIDRYVRVNVQGIEKLIDALGGVTFYVPKDMKYQDDSQHLYINLKQGEQHLNGEKAVQFLRFRHDAYGDIGRVQRQQKLMRSVVEQALQPKTILRMPKILSIIQSHIDTNLTVEEIIALASFAANTERSDVEMLLLPGEFSGNDEGNAGYWLPDSDRIKEIVAQHFGADSPNSEASDPANLRVAIQDSTGDPEAVQAMVDNLGEAGYQNVYISRDWQEPLQVTRIIAQRGDRSSAKELQAALGVGEVLVESTGSLASDVTIQLGEDWQEQYVPFE